jgi:tetratricopeptide (TPR) repeat protein
MVSRPNESSNARVDNAETWIERGQELRRLGRLEEALAAYGEAIDLDSERIDARYHRARALIDLGRHAAALADLDRAVEIDPEHADTHYLRGQALAKLERSNEALRAYDRALALRPGHVLGHLKRGNCLWAMARGAEALAAYDRVLELAPNNTEAHANRGNALWSLGRFEEALRSLDRAIELKPDFALAFYNRGIVQGELGRLDHALADYRQAIALHPTFAPAHNNLGQTLLDLGRRDEALASFQRAQKLDPDYPEVNLNLSLYHLLTGQLRAGWEGYEWRWRVKKQRPWTRDRAKPRWHGQFDPRGKTVLLHGEQGLGDTLQFCRYARKVADLGARVILEIAPSLMPVLGRIAGVDRLVAHGAALPHYDAYCSLLSLPRAFATELDTIPAETRYLDVPAGRLADWAARLGPKIRPRVGIAWSGNTDHVRDRERSIPLAEFMAALPADLGIDYIALQPEARAADAEALRARADILFPGVALGDFGDTGALCDLVDLVVSVDTSVVHLAAGLGRPTWISTRYNPDWRWFLERDDSPWYPSVKLYRQARPGEWGPVLERIAADLRGRFAVPDSDTHASVSASARDALLQGDHARARALYEQVLALRPDDLNALNLLGICAIQARDYVRAVTWFDRALASDPDNAETQCNRAHVLRQSKRPEDAFVGYTRAIDLRPDYFDALYFRGRVLLDLRRPADALPDFEAATRLNPDHGGAHYRLGLTLGLLKRNAEAVSAYDRALAIQPEQAIIHHKRGNVLYELKRGAEALRAYDRAIELAPDYAEAHANRGNTLWLLDRLEEAEQSLDRAITLKPDFGTAFYNRGIIRGDLGRIDDALADTERALKLLPDFAPVHNNHGKIMLDLGRLAQAEASYQRALAIDPEYAEANLNLGLYQLLTGRFEAGWRNYEWRWRIVEQRPVVRGFTQAAWLGQFDITGKTILLHGEQGLGDALQFCRYTRLVSALGARVILEASPALLPVLGGLAGVDQLIAHGAPLPEFDVHCPLLSLPLAFNTTLETIPTAPHYIEVPTDYMATWSARLGPKTRPRVGLVWSGNARHKSDRDRSIALKDLLQYLPTDLDIEYICLQKELRATDQAALSTRPDIAFHGGALADFGDTGALCELVDLVISVDTSVAHLAAALGRPTWIPTRFNPDWRWLLERDDSPWYPTVRLYRQAGPGDWRAALARLNVDLRTRFQRPDAEARRALLAEAGARHRQGDLEGASQRYHQVLNEDGHDFDALHMLGVIAIQRRRPGEAVGLIEQALTSRPDSAEARYNLGLAWRDQGQNETALACFERAVELRPDYVEAHLNRGKILRRLGRRDAALAAYQRVIDLSPGNAEVYNNRANILLETGLVEAAIADYRQALARNPAYAEAHNNLGNALSDLGDYPGAIASLDRAIALAPDYANAHFNLGLVYLRLGRYAEGWREYEWRFRRPGETARHAGLPAWRGASEIAGKTLLVFAEQGMGDTVQFCRYIKRLGARGARVVVEVPAPLRGLLAENLAGHAQVIAMGDSLPTIDLACPLLSLPLALGDSGVEVESSYLRADPDRVETWSQALGATTTTRIGLAWSGQSGHSQDARRSIPLAELVAVLPRAPGLEYLGLQKELRESDRVALAARPDIRFLGPELGDFGDTAALCKLVDLVISVDTSVAHLAGALGRPTWLLLQFSPDWRWLLGRVDSPWYPDMRLYRQEWRADWSGPLARLGADLRERYGLESATVPGELLRAAEAEHRAGHLARARALYEHILRLSPGDFDALHMLGVIAIQRRDPRRGVELIGQALARRPDNAEAYYNQAIALRMIERHQASLESLDRALTLNPLHAEAHGARARALRALDRSEEALASYDRALELKPDSASILANRGSVLRHLKRPEEALASFDRAIALDPDLAEAHGNRCNALRDLKRPEEALASIDRALALKPERAEFHNSRGNVLRDLERYEEALAVYDDALARKPDYAEAWSNRGNALRQLRRTDEAVTSIGRALELRPDMVEAHNNLGNTLKDMGRYDEALASYARALALRPGYAQAYNNRANLWFERGFPVEALADYDQAVRFDPRYAEAWSNRGNALADLGRHGEAMASYARALECRPDYPEAELNSALGALRLGDFESGWRRYEYRWRRGDGLKQQRHYPTPLWLGQVSPRGKTVHIYNEQGLGDTLQFCRYAKPLAELGARVVLEAQAPLLGLLASLEGPSLVIGRDDPKPDIDLHCPLLSLPLAFNTRLDDIPDGVPYLRVDPGKTRAWAERLGAPAGPRVGLVWSGNPKHKKDHARSLALKDFAAFLPADAGFEYIALQKEARADDRATLAARPDIRFLGDELKDFSDTAALCELVDLVISVDTSVAHLAGALGRPLWILVQFNPDWRWLLGRADTPWYPSARLYRQHALGDWNATLAAARADLLAGDWLERASLARIT